MRFQDQSIVVTGGNSGIGRASAKAFSKLGGKVAILGRDSETLSQTVSELGIWGQTCDVTDQAALSEFMDKARGNHGPIDILFANAGIAEFVPFADCDADHFQRVMDVNFHGTVKTIAAALPHLNDGARVILTTSIANQMGEPASSAYAASKAAVRSLASTLSRDLVARKIRVNALSPGPTATPIFAKMGLEGEAFVQTRATLNGAIPAGRMGQEADQVEAVLFLASEKNSFLMGQELIVDGGLTGCNGIY